MRKLTVTKRFTPTGLAAVPYNSSYSTYANGEWGHYVIGLISNQEYHSVEGNRPQGGHTSYYAVNFGDYGGTYTMWVSIKGLWEGTAVKNAGG